MKNADYANTTCPYLGLLDDPDTSHGFPSNWNYCHHSCPTACPKLEYQTEYCLSKKHLQCLVLLNQQLVPLPNYLRTSRSYVTAPKRCLSQVAVYIFVGIMVLVGLAWGFLVQDPVLSKEPPTALVTKLLVERETSPLIFNVSVTAPANQTITDGTLTVTHTATLARTPTFTNTVTSSLTSILSKHRLDVLIGTDYKFAIHRVAGGENFNQYADKYKTSVKAIVAINYNLKTPVRVGTLVIIPAGFTEVANLPDFEAYKLAETGKSLEALAQELGVRVADLKYYNAVDAAESLVIGDWLLVPRSESAP